MNVWIGGRGEKGKEGAGVLTPFAYTHVLIHIHPYIQVQRWAHRYRLLRAIDRSLMENGLKMVFLLRCVVVDACGC